MKKTIILFSVLALTFIVACKKSKTEDNFKAEYEIQKDLR
jgi:hypothetical protein